MFTKKELITKEIDFSYFKESLNSEKKYLEQYFEINSEKISETNNQFSDKLLEQIEENPSLESKIIAEYESSFRAINSYYFHSSIALIHTYFESYISQLCNKITDHTLSSFSLQLLKGNNLIKTALDYLKLTTGLNDEIINIHKPRLGKFQNLRNKIIHENSTYKDDTDKAKLENGFSGKIEFDETNNKFFLKDDELAIEYLEKSNIFLNEIIIILSEKEFVIENTTPNTV
ncbi:hypothetical protein [Maribacter litoralis]|uniref:hypothetical protein n=1 Tax=Maribacter litoralis TaxID=2059726 RepID=UPI000E31504A|nr:hypothetical protein [Maribacter litoralis]